MHIHSEHLRLSPSVRRHGLPRLRAPDDALARARARRARPARGRERAGGADLPQGARARARLPRAPPRRREDRPRDRRPATATTTAPRARPRGDPRRRGRRHLPGRLRARAAGAASPTSSLPPAGRRLRGARHQARAHAKPAYILQLCFYTEQLARIQGPRAGEIHVLLGIGRAGDVPTRGVRRLLPARPLAARAVRRRPAADRAVPGRPLRCLRLHGRSATRGGTRSTTSSRVAGVYRTSDREARGRRDHDARGSSAARRRSPCRPGSTRDTWAKLREQAELQLHARETGEDTLPAPAAAAGSRLRAPARALAGRPLLRLRGQPVLGRATAALEYLWGILDADGDFTPLHAHDHDDRAAGVRARSSTSSTSGSRATPTCTSTTTPPTRSRRCSG